MTDLTRHAENCPCPTCETNRKWEQPPRPGDAALATRWRKMRLRIETLEQENRDLRALVASLQKGDGA